MPFTISHTAAILPFNRKPFVLSALIIGSMSPDFLYFIPLIPNYHFTHTLPGLFLFCLPMSWVALLGFDRLIKRPLILLLPSLLQRRAVKVYKGFTFSKFSQCLWISLSIILGAYSHIVWDSFTHLTGKMVQLFPLLQQPIFTLWGETIFVYKFLQYGSTIIGGLIFMAWLLWQIKQEKPNSYLDKNPNKVSSLLLPTIIVLSCSIGLISSYLWFTPLGLKIFVVQTVITSMSTFLSLLLLFSLGWHWLAMPEKKSY